jgi:uncharacterized protein
VSAPLRALHEVTFSYERSVGGATEQFLRGLARGELLGSRTADGRVVVPPVDHDPDTGASVDGLVRVGDAGEVRSWTWVDTPRPEHPLAEPFAFALIQLDGSDTPFLHVVVVDAPEELATGMRVRADWRATRHASILDIRAFVPDAGTATPPLAGTDDAADPVTVRTELRVPYTFEPGLVLSDFHRALAAGRITGGLCATCATVYVPPHASCPACGTLGMSPVDVADRGVVTAFAVVHLPVPGMDLDLPFAWAWIRLDGSDVPFPHLLGEVAPEDVHVGQRVEAVWVAERDRPRSWEAIEHFRPVAP